MQKWEYRVCFTITVPTQDELNQFGTEGWELVTVVAGTTSRGSGYLAYFKRPKE